MKRWLIPLVVLLSLFPLPLVGAEAAVRVETREIPSWDGVVLSADLYWHPSIVDTAVPAILMTHGWAGAKEDLVEEAEWLAGLGYVVLAYDSRGFGASEGTVGLNGPDEWADVSHLVSWLAGLQETGGPNVLVDDAETEDPRIGMYGYSYGGAIQLLAAAHDDRIDALVPDITWSDLGESLAPNGVVKRGWVDLLFWGGLLGAHGARQGNPNAGGMDERLQEWYLAALQTGRLPAEADEALAERSPIHYLDAVHADVLLTQGWRDTLFDPDEAVATYVALSAREEAATHLLFHSGGHGHALDGPQEGHVRDQVASFLSRHLDEADVDPIAAVQWHDPQAKAWHTAEGWPAATGVLRTGPAGPTDRLLLAQAPAATSHTETQEFQGELGPTTTDTPLPTSGQILLDVSGPALFLGTPVVRLNVTPTVDDLTLFLSLVDIGLTGAERVVGNQVTAVRVEGENGETVALEVPLVGIAHTARAGHTLALRVATSDTGYLGSREPGTVEVDARGLRVDLPAYDPQADAEDPGDAEGSRSRESPGLLLPFLGALFVLAVVARSRRRM